MWSHVIISHKRSLFSNDVNLPQLASSVPSRQSHSSSQRSFAGRQRLLLSHWWTQPSVCFVHCSSSERSWHWGISSHTCSLSIHIFPWAHWNWPVWVQILAVRASYGFDINENYCSPFGLSHHSDVWMKAKNNTATLAKWHNDWLYTQLPD